MKESATISGPSASDGHPPSPGHKDVSTTCNSSGFALAARPENTAGSCTNNPGEADGFLACLIDSFAPRRPGVVTPQVLSKGSSCESEFSSAHGISPTATLPGSAHLAWGSVAAAAAGAAQWNTPGGTMVVSVVAASPPPTALAAAAAMVTGAPQGSANGAPAQDRELSQHGDASHQLLMQKLEDLLASFAAAEVCRAGTPDPAQQPRSAAGAAAPPDGPARREGGSNEGEQSGGRAHAAGAAAAGAAAVAVGSLEDGGGASALGPAESQIAECIREAREDRIWSPRELRAMPGGKQAAQSLLDALGSGGQLWRAVAREQAALARRKWEIDMGEIVLQNRIAVGGYSEVFRAAWHGTPVAVKRLTHTVASLPEVVEQFGAEVAMLADIRHPNLVLFMGFCRKPPTYSIITEYMHRGSLCRILAQSGPLEVARQFSVAMAIARGLAYLHSRSPPIVHTDLKSPNILVNDKWHVKVCDFGLARYKGAHPLHAPLGGGAVAGTPAWMPPEVLLGDRPADEAADIFSYGVLLWELMTGKEPWAGYSRNQVVAAVAFQNQRLEVPEDAHPVLAALARSCWLPAGSRPTCGQVLAQLESHRVPRRTASMGASPRGLRNSLSREPSMDLSDVPAE